MFIWFELNQNIIHYIDTAQRYIQCVIFCHRVLSEKSVPIYIAVSINLPKFIKTNFSDKMRLQNIVPVPTLFGHNLTISILKRPVRPNDTRPTRTFENIVVTSIGDINYVLNTEPADPS